MKNVILVAALLFVVSCGKKDTFGYNCTCKNKSSGIVDTFYTVRVQTSGEAIYNCQEYGRVADSQGRNIECNID